MFDRAKSRQRRDSSQEFGHLGLHFVYLLFYLNVKTTEQEGEFHCRPLARHGTARQ